MKIPLRYQMTEYDCGPTSLLNGLSYLFEREEIPPEIPRSIMLFCLDKFDVKGASGKAGTSHTAMQFLSHWLSGFGETGALDVGSSYLHGGDVTLAPGSYLRAALCRGAAAVARVDLGGWHYVLLTGACGQDVFLFDPYLLPREQLPPGVRIVDDRPLSHNRIVPLATFESTGLHPYAFGPYEQREAVLLFNSRTIESEDQAVDYVI